MIVIPWRAALGASDRRKRLAKLSDSEAMRVGDGAFGLSGGRCSIGKRLVFLVGAAQLENETGNLLDEEPTLIFCTVGVAGSPTGKY